MLNGLVNTPSVSREIKDLQQKNIGDPATALQSMLARGIDPYLAQAVATTMTMQQAAKMQGARPPQGTVVDKTLSMGLPAAQGANSVGAQGFAGGGIVAFSGSNPDGTPGSSEVQDDDSWTDDKERAFQNLDKQLNDPSVLTPLPESAKRRYAELKAQRDRIKGVDTRKDSYMYGAGTPDIMADARRRDSTNIFQTEPTTQSPAAATGIATQAPTPPPSQATPRATTRTPAATTSAPGITSVLPQGIKDTAESIYGADIKKGQEGLKSEEEYQQEAADKYRKLGIGQAADKFSSVVDKLKSEYEGSGADKANMKQSILEAAASLLSSKSQYFGVAAGEALKAGTAGYYARQKENKKAAFDLAKTTFELNQAKENLSLSTAQEGTKKFDTERGKVEALQDKQRTLMGNLLGDQLKGAQERQTRLDVARIEAASRQAVANGNFPPELLPHYRKFIAAMEKGDNATADAEAEIVNRGLSLTPKGAIAEKNVAAKKEAAREAALSKARSSPGVTMAEQMYTMAQNSLSAAPSDPAKQSRAESAKTGYVTALRRAGLSQEEIGVIIGGDTGDTGGAASAPTVSRPTSLIDKYSPK